MEQNLITTKNKFTYNHIALIIHILPLFFSKIEIKSLLASLMHWEQFNICGGHMDLSSQYFT